MFGVGQGSDGGALRRLNAADIAGGSKAINLVG